MGTAVQNSEIEELAAVIINRLLAEGFTVQRYNAYTTNSIYLKLDYGVCNSIRISDHPGKKYLKYRYNIGPHIRKFRKEKDKYDRFYYRVDRSRNMLERIIRDRDAKKSQYGEPGYQALVQENRDANTGKLGFWSKAVLLNGER